MRFFKNGKFLYVVDENKRKPEGSVEISIEEFETALIDNQTSPSDEQLFVTSELAIADINIRLHDDGDERAFLDRTDWENYRKTLRDYVKDGEITLNNRPQRPS